VRGVFFVVRSQKRAVGVDALESHPFFSIFIGNEKARIAYHFLAGLLRPGYFGPIYLYAACAKWYPGWEAIPHGRPIRAYFPPIEIVPGLLCHVCIPETDTERKKAPHFRSSGADDHYGH
jgi:hypothetical protein